MVIFYFYELIDLSGNWPFFLKEEKFMPVELIDTLLIFTPLGLLLPTLVLSMGN